MTLILKRLFATSMTDGPDLVGPPAPPSPRSAKRKMMFITLAGILARSRRVVGAFYFAMLPVTLRNPVRSDNLYDVRGFQGRNASVTHYPDLVLFGPML